MKYSKNLYLHFYVHDPVHVSHVNLEVNIVDILIIMFYVIFNDLFFIFFVASLCQLYGIVLYFFIWNLFMIMLILKFNLNVMNVMIFFSCTFDPYRSDIYYLQHHLFSTCYYTPPYLPRLQPIIYLHHKVILLSLEYEILILT